MRDPRDKFTSVSSVYSAAGVKLVSPDLEGVIPGTPVITFSDGKEFAAAKVEAERDLLVLGSNKDTVGVMVKAGSIGGLEALLLMLKERNIPVRYSDIGDISKTDLAEASSIADTDPFLGVILGFDVKMLPEAKEGSGQAKIFLSDVIYEVIENYSQWVEQKKTEDERIAISSLTLPAKFKALPGNFFRRNDPAIFGVEIVAGRLRSKARLMGPDGKEVGVLEQIQDQGKPVDEAKLGTQVAISVKGPTLGRQIKENDNLYTFPTSREAKLLRTKFIDSLSDDEKLALEEIIRIRSASDPLFGF
jgi:translation initiation factor 5B